MLFWLFQMLLIYFIISKLKWELFNKTNKAMEKSFCLNLQTSLGYFSKGKDTVGSG